MIREVLLSARAQKEIRRVPLHIRDKLLRWIELVGEIGLEEVRRIPGFHDEPLHGDRRGQRSVRLNRAYRAIYVIGAKGTIEFVSVEEVNKHDY